MQTNFSGIIVAAGSGVRMGGIRKPLIKLQGRPVIAYVLDAFCDSECDEIIIVGDEAELCPHTFGRTKPIRFVAGGRTRTESVFAGVNAAKNRLCCVHDCARPFVTKDMISSVTAAAREKGAATACTRVTDTIKYVDRDRKSVYAPDRDFLFAVQTPQSFDKYAFFAAYATAQKNGGAFTDESTMLENAGFYVEYVICDGINMKLTTVTDVKVAKAIKFLEEKG